RFARRRSGAGFLPGARRRAGRRGACSGAITRRSGPTRLERAGRPSWPAGWPPLDPAGIIAPGPQRRHGSGNVSLEEALEELRAGRMIILMDDEDRENEGDLCVAAERVTPEHINFMATHGRGLICLSLTEHQCEQLGLPMMVRENRAPLGTAFTVSI